MNPRRFRAAWRPGTNSPGGEKAHHLIRSPQELARCNWLNCSRSGRKTSFWRSTIASSRQGCRALSGWTCWTRYRVGTRAQPTRTSYATHRCCWADATASASSLPLNCAMAAPRRDRRSCSLRSNRSSRTCRCSRSMSRRHRIRGNSCRAGSGGQADRPERLFIAAHAYALGAVIVTANVAEFSRIRGPKVEKTRQ